MKGTGHGIITIGLAGSLLYLSLEYGLSKDVSGALVGGCLSGLVLSPDLDLAENVSLKRFYLIPWWLYGRIMPHRSFFSHAPVVGTFIRVLYLLLMLWVTMWLLHLPTNWIPYGKWIPYAFFGLVVADTGHFIADQISTFFKKLIGRRE